MGNRVTEASSHANIVIDRHLFASRVTDHLADVPRRTPRVLVRVQHNVVNLKRMVIEFYHNRLPMLIDSHLMLTISTDYSNEHQSSQQQQWPTAHVRLPTKQPAHTKEAEQVSFFFSCFFFSFTTNRSNPRKRARGTKSVEESLSLESSLKSFPSPRTTDRPQTSLLCVCSDAHTY